MWGWRLGEVNEVQEWRRAKGGVEGEKRDVPLLRPLRIRKERKEAKKEGEKKKKQVCS